MCRKLPSMGPPVTKGLLSVPGLSVLPSSLLNDGVDVQTRWVSQFPPVVQHIFDSKSSLVHSPKLVMDGSWS